MANQTPKRRRPFRRLCVALILVALLWFVPSTAALNWMGADEDDGTQRADCIFVPGMAVYGAREPGLGLRARLLKALELYRAGRAPTIVVSGGDKGDHNEAAVMADWLIARGVPEGAIVAEKQARSTRENGLYSAPLMRDRGIRSALIVSQWFHLPRVRIALRDEGIETTNIPCQGPGLMDGLPYMGREAVLMPVHACSADLWFR